MTRTEIIQLLIDRYEFKSYVEIGTQYKKNNFDKIRCDYKLSVDPDHNSDADIHKTSDDFFYSWKVLKKLAFFDSSKVDIILIDGLHERTQVSRDIENALYHLSDNGFIIVHDCNPPNELVQRMPRPDRSITKSWTGDVWKAIVELRWRSDIVMYTVDTDWGCGIIKKGWQAPLKVIDELTYDNLNKNRLRWLNLISVDYFKELHAKIVQS